MEIRWATLFWTTFGTLCIIEFVLIVVSLVYVTKEQLPISTDSLDFALYKNTRFQQCSTQTIASQPDCSAARLGNLSHWGLASSQLSDPDYPRLDLSKWASASFALLEPDYPRLSKPNDWCSLSTCFKDFKIIPSRPRAGAFPLTGLTVWLTVTFTAITAMFGLRRALLGGGHDTEDCYKPRFGILDWLGYVVDLVSTVWWWRELFAAARDPTFATTASLLAWFTPWRYAYMLRRHPLGCKLDGHATAKRVATVSSVAIAVAMWVATCWLINVKAADIGGPLVYSYLLQRYDCATELFDQAPGNTTCSVDKLCQSGGRLLGDIGIPDSGPASSMLQFYFMLFVFLTVSSVLTSLYALARAGHVPFPEWLDDLGDSLTLSRWGTSNVLALPIVFIILVCLITPIIAIDSLTHAAAAGGNREAAVAYDWDCRAVHVAMSPWRQYLDIHGFDQWLRIAKAWFNA